MSARPLRQYLGTAVLLLTLFISAHAAAEDAVVHIDTSRHGAPISQYVYGQFIEHFGYCIDSGLWAEILRDRKFFDAVGEGESPWKSSGAQLAMDENEPFTGKWTPALTLSGSEPGVLSQGALRLKAGVDFAGYLWVRPSEGVSRIEVSLHSDSFSPASAWNAESGELKPNEYQKLDFSWPVGAESSFDAEFRITAEGTGTVYIGCASLMPSDNVGGIRADTLRCLQELDSPIYRWPGGNFVSGYDWKDGIGDRDRRPPRKNPAWPGIEMNDFGFDEFMSFCDLLKTEPYVAVNTGNGKTAEALEELEYALGSPNSKFGKLRAENGHHKPYKIRFWGIGNEMYGDWQIGHIPVEEYVKKNNEFADAFHEAYPDLFLIGVGNVGPWNDAFIPGAFQHIESLSEHFYDGRAKDPLERAGQLARSVKRIADAHDKYRDRWPELYANRSLPVSLDEWNYAGGPLFYGQAGIRFELIDGLGVASGLHEIFRRSDLFFMANYAQTINVLGAVKTTPTGAELDSTGVVLALYRKAYGTLPVAAWVDDEDPLAPGTGIDAAAAFTEDERFLTVGLVNPFGETKTVRLDLPMEPAGKVKMWRAADTEGDPAAYNEPDVTPRITISKTAVSLKHSEIALPKYTVTILKIPAYRGRQ